MLTETVHHWKCDFCNGAGVSHKANHVPEGWREFKLSERFAVKDYYFTHETKELGWFACCDECNKRKYHDMHPIRAMLSKIGVLR